MLESSLALSTVAEKGNPLPPQLTMHASGQTNPYKQLTHIFIASLYIEGTQYATNIIQ